jgi:hypothetical protein
MTRAFSRGFPESAASFAKATDIGATRRIVIAAVCDRPLCDGCAKSSAKSETLRWRSPFV